MISEKTVQCSTVSCCAVSVSSRILIFLVGVWRGGVGMSIIRDGLTIDDKNKEKVSCFPFIQPSLIQPLMTLH